MRIETPTWTATGAIKIGHDHLYRGINCHDAFNMDSVRNTVFGVVCDGCGSGAHSEVGAKLLSLHAAKTVEQNVEKHSILIALEEGLQTPLHQPNFVWLVSQTLVVMTEKPREAWW